MFRSDNKDLFAKSAIIPDDVGHLRNNTDNGTIPEDKTDQHCMGNRKEKVTAILPKQDSWAAKKGVDPSPTLEQGVEDKKDDTKPPMMVFAARMFGLLAMFYVTPLLIAGITIFLEFKMIERQNNQDTTIMQADNSLFNFTAQHEVWSKIQEQKIHDMLKYLPFLPLLAHFFVKENVRDQRDAEKRVPRAHSSQSAGSSGPLVYLMTFFVAMICIFSFEQYFPEDMTKQAKHAVSSIVFTVFMAIAVWLHIATRVHYKKMTTKELKKILQKRNLSTIGPHRHLVNRLMDHHPLFGSESGRYDPPEAVVNLLALKKNITVKKLKENLTDRELPCDGLEDDLLTKVWIPTRFKELADCNREELRKMLKRKKLSPSGLKNKLICHLIEAGH